MSPSMAFRVHNRNGKVSTRRVPPGRPWAPALPGRPTRPPAPRWPLQRQPISSGKHPLAKRGLSSMAGTSTWAFDRRAWATAPRLTAGSGGVSRESGAVGVGEGWQVSADSGLYTGVPSGREPCRQERSFPSRVWLLVPWQPGTLPPRVSDTPVSLQLGEPAGKLSRTLVSGSRLRAYGLDTGGQGSISPHLCRSHLVTSLALSYNTPRSDPGSPGEGWCQRRACRGRGSCGPKPSWREGRGVPEAMGRAVSPTGPRPDQGACALWGCPRGLHTDGGQSTASAGAEITGLCPRLPRVTHS